jgi:hypothetical protein
MLQDNEVEDLTNSASQLTVAPKQNVPADPQAEQGPHVESAENDKPSSGNPLSSDDEPLHLKITKRKRGGPSKELASGGKTSMLTRSQAKMLDDVGDSAKGKEKQKAEKVQEQETIVHAPGRSYQRRNRSTRRSTRNYPKSKKRDDLEDEDEDDGEDDHKKAPKKVNVIIDLTGDVSDSRTCHLS